MKFVCTQNNLLQGISVVSPLAGRNTQLPVLQHVLLEVNDGVLNLTCTDLEVGAHVAVAGKAESDGRCTVVARQLLDYVQQLPVSEPIVIEKKKRGLAVTTKGFKAQFSIAEADDFPLLPTPPETNKIAIDGRLFCRAISQTIFAAARDETRPEIYSLFIGGDEGEIRVAATDSFRLAEQVVPLETKDKFSFLLPVATASEVSRLFSSTEELELSSQDNLVVWRGDGVYLSSRLVDGNYPDYRQIIPGSFTTQGVVGREELLRALKVLGVFLPRESRRVKMSVQPNKELLELGVEGGEAGEGRVSLDFKGEGDEAEVLFNIQYLLDGVQHLSSEKCELGLSGEGAPIVLRPHNDEASSVYVVMPIQV